MCVEYIKVKDQGFTYLVRYGLFVYLFSPAIPNMMPILAVELVTGNLVLLTCVFVHMRMDSKLFLQHILSYFMRKRIHLIMNENLMKKLLA